MTVQEITLVGDRVAQKMGIPRLDASSLDIFEKVTHKNGFVRGFGIVTIPTKHNNVCNPSYAIWNAVMQRCHDEVFKRNYPTYADCRCSVEWQMYKNFDRWYDNNFVEGFHLDKDILVPGNKIYGPSYCRFVPSELNMFFTKRTRLSGEYPQGIQFDVARNKLVVRFHGIDGNQHIGRFELDQVEEAEAAYKDAKGKNLLALAAKYKSVVCPEIYRTVIYRARNGIF